ncbi:MAG: PD40 domain-containing protein, partial [Ignavibacteriaceae bacterium]|nr:PD40 domain-containing protein [Ignavibacteriaceae bacterium]
MRISLIKVFLLLLTVQMFSQQEARLLRFPAIHGEKIAFSYAGDLYIVNAAGGVARKITSDIGYEMFPKFSPDGKYIAFTGQYDGNTEVYLIPAEGGIPKRLTYTATLGRDDVSDRMGPNNIVMAWKDNETIMYRSRWREFNDWKGQLYTVSIKGGLSEQLPLPRGGFGTFNSDGTKLVYNRVFREFRTWKRYRGGQADDIWIYDLKSKKTERVLENPAQDIFPMWVGDKIYFTSDRDNTLNLYVHDLKTNATTQLTKYTDFDVKFPSAGSNAIVYENGGYIYKYDIAAGKAEKVTIYINEDFAVGRNEMIDVSREVSNFEISPDGNRAMFGARGEIFTVPVKNGPTRNITGSMGVHERASKWSPDGKYIAYISDRSGEDEIYIKPQNGLGDETQLTKGSSYYKFSLIWSSDSKKILFHDQSYGLFYVDIESKKTVKVDQGEVSPIGQYDISPDGYWIAYSKNERDQMSNVYLYSVAENKSYKVTDGWFASGQPEFSEDGSFLYFVSSRTFNPRYGWTEWNHIYVDMAKIYMVPLAKSTKSPFEPKSDEVTIKSDSDGEKGKDDKKNGGDAAKDSKTAVVDTEGLTERIIEVPVQPASYFNLASAGDKLFYQRNSSSDSRPKLLVY